MQKPPHARVSIPLALCVLLLSFRAALAFSGESLGLFLTLCAFSL